MYVVATAGHVDHGKSTLLRALTGMEPDRWAEEQRRGMTLDLGFVWTTLPSGEDVAFVDVPGHERFVPTMLAGVGSVAAVLFVVAADEGWQAQSAEHLAALDALGVEYCVIAVTRSDLADPGPALAQAAEQVAETTLRPVAAVGVSAVTGAGLPELRASLHQLLQSLPLPDTGGDVRLWADRSFVIRGAGTVVTGTLSQGTIAAGDELEIGPGGAVAQIRGIQALHQQVGKLEAAARAAVNLRRVSRDQIGRGQALLTPGAWLPATEVDVRLTVPAQEVPAWQTLHLGTAAVSVQVRRLGRDTARLKLRAPLPLRIGDRALLRDPGRRLVRAGVVVLDPRPPALRRRGAGAARAAILAGMTGTADPDAEVARRGVLPAADLRRLGAPGTPAGAVASGPWLVARPLWERWRRGLVAAVDEHALQRPLDSGLPAAAAAAALELPEPRLATALAAQAPELAVHGGRISRRDRVPELPPGIETVITRLRAEPFAAPEAADLRDLDVSPAALAAAIRLGVLLDVGGGIYLLPGADQQAARLLAAGPQPFTVADARQALGTSRRVAVPLLEYLDARRRTRRVDSSHRVLLDGGR